MPRAATRCCSPASATRACSRCASRASCRFSIITGGPAWKPMLERLAVALGYGDALASVRALPLTGPALALDPSTIPEEVRKAVEEDGARSVIIGGAALAGIAGRIAERVGVPLIDSVACSARAVANLCSRS